MSGFEHLDDECRRAMALDLWEARGPKDLDYIIPLRDNERERISQALNQIDALLPLVQRILGHLYDDEDGERWRLANLTLAAYLTEDARYQRAQNRVHDPLDRLIDTPFYRTARKNSPWV